MKTLFILPDTIAGITKSSLALKGVRDTDRMNGTIALAAREDHASFVSSLGIADDVIPLKPSQKMKNYWKLRRHHFDRVVDLQGNRESASLGRWVRKQDNWGFGDLPENIQKKYSNVVSFPASKPSQEYRYHHLLKNATGIHSFSIAPSILPGSDEVTRGEMFARQLQNPVILSVQGTLPSQQWPVKFFIELCQWLTSRGRTPVLVGSAEDAAKATTIIETAGMGISLCGNTSLESLAGMTMVAGIYTGVQSDAMYVADMVGARVSALYGSTSLALQGPVHHRATCIESTIRCAPCSLAHCPADNSCTNHIYPEDIIEQLQAFGV